MLETVWEALASHTVVSREGDQPTPAASSW
jgi:hypothetical protein